MKRHLAELERFLTENGYLCRPPNTDVEEIDAAIAGSMMCCGSKMDYEPWSKRGSYVALAVCWRCGNYVEF